MSTLCTEAEALAALRLIAAIEGGYAVRFLTDKYSTRSLGYCADAGNWHSLDGPPSHIWLRDNGILRQVDTWSDWPGQAYIGNDVPTKETTP